jgi:hypothetical protein
LIGVDPVSSSFGSDTYLFIPDLSTGKYIKTTVGDVGTNASVYYAAVSNSVTWDAIPYVTDALGPDYLQTNDDLTAYSNTASYQGYRGDICRFLSNSTGVSGSWRLPKSAEFGYGVDYVITGMTNAASETTTDVNGKDPMTYYVTSEAISHNGKEVTFPASGCRNYNSNLNNVGLAGFYWSLSASSWENAYKLLFNSSDATPYLGYGRYFGFSLKCVRE